MIFRPFNESFSKSVLPCVTIRKRPVSFSFVAMLLLLFSTARTSYAESEEHNSSHESPAVEAHGHTAEADAHGAEGEDHAGGEHHTKHLENWFSLSFGEGKKYQNGPFAFAILNFIILLWLVKRFASKPFKEYLQNRHESIRKDLEEAAKMRQAAEAKLKEVQIRVNNMNKEIEDIKQSVAKDAELEKGRIIRGAEEEAKRIVAQADKTLEQDLRRIRKTLESEAVNAAIIAAEKLIKKNITDTDQNKIVEEYFYQITASGGKN